jgi:hypothetical protein
MGLCDMGGSWFLYTSQPLKEMEKKGVQMFEFLNNLWELGTE